jgi:hypothetical protein
MKTIRVLVTVSACVAALSLPRAAAAETSGGLLGGVFLTAVGASLTITGTIITPWEELDEVDWRTGVVFGLGGALLLVGSIVWGVAARRARERRIERAALEEAAREAAPPVPEEPAPPQGAVTAPVSATPEEALARIDGSLHGCLLLAHQTGEFTQASVTVRIAISTDGVLSYEGAVPEPPSSVSDCFRDSVAEARVPPSGSALTVDHQIDVTAEAEPDHEEVADDPGADGDAPEDPYVEPAPPPAPAPPPGPQTQAPPAP